MSKRCFSFSRSYTKKNCELECQSNYTLRQCECVPYFLPKDTRTRICSKSDEVCSNNAKENMELIYGNGSSCHCLSACFELTYESVKSYSNLAPNENAYRDISENMTAAYFVDNMVVLHMYFPSSKFIKQVKSELYGSTEILSNIGGLLGLCMGFSFLSLVELFYFVTLRAFCLYARKFKRIKHNSNELNTSIPFMR